MASFGAFTKQNFDPTGLSIQGWSVSEQGFYTSITTNIFRPVGNNNVYLGIYSNRTDTQFGNYPFELEGTTAAISDTGDQTADLVTPVLLKAGTHWIIFQADGDHTGVIPGYRGTPAHETLRFVVSGVSIPFPATFPADQDLDPNNGAKTDARFSAFA